MRKKGIRTKAIHTLVKGLYNARKTAIEYKASIPNTWHYTTGRTDYYIHNTAGTKEAIITAIFYDGTKEYKKINYDFYAGLYEHLNKGVTA